ncbi:MAG TPA: tryptophan synthase subunit alpha [Solirubrobacteraceae bacterium]|nr:tryptophan synthase subunit alpha [Solirubrobacteraceae bacterium]
MSGAARIAAGFESARADGLRAALMPYLMGGFPDLETSLEIGHACAEAGAAMLELGVPFSDPLADGPVIHAAGTAALGNGVRLAQVLEVAAGLAPEVPVVVMCYANPILARGLERFCDQLRDAGVSGLIVPDLPLEEAGLALRACDARELALVPLVAPTTPESRLAQIGRQARGFVYTVSVTGTTGERARVDGALESLLRRVGAHTDVPVAVGFGISAPDHARAAADAGAAGVIVGTRLVRAAGEADDPPAAVGELLAEFREALRTTNA